MATPNHLTEIYKLDLKPGEELFVSDMLSSAILAAKMLERRGKPLTLPMLTAFLEAVRADEDAAWPKVMAQAVNACDEPVAAFSIASCRGTHEQQLQARALTALSQHVFLLFCPAMDAGDEKRMLVGGRKGLVEFIGPEPSPLMWRMAEALMVGLEDGDVRPEVRQHIDGLAANLAA